MKLKNMNPYSSYSTQINNVAAIPTAISALSYSAFTFCFAFTGDRDRCMTA